jgi:hypothetical protein
LHKCGPDTPVTAQLLFTDPHLFSLSWWPTAGWCFYPQSSLVIPGYLLHAHHASYGACWELTPSSDPVGESLSKPHFAPLNPNLLWPQLMGSEVIFHLRIGQPVHK